MPLIPFPDVPDVPGVPAVPRSGAPVAQVITLSLGAAQAALSNASQVTPVRWGIYTTATGALLGQLGAPSKPATLSTNKMDYTKETRVSDYPIENGGFASYNKVQLPGQPKITMVLDGTVDDRTAYLTAIDAAIASTEVYSVVTPEFTYSKCTLEKYAYGRSAEKGANLLVVEISLKEIRTVSASYTNNSSTPASAAAPALPNANSPNALPQSVSGLIQGAPATVAQKITAVLQGFLFEGNAVPLIVP